MSQGGKSRLWLRALIPVLAFVIIAAIPAPQGLSWNAWIFFALFIATLIGAILEPLPTAAVVWIGVTLAATFQLVYPGNPSKNLSWAVTGFGDSTIWFITAAYLYSVAFLKTGLGKRIALYFVRLVGKNTLGLGYSIALADVPLTLFIPTNAGRNGGVLYPIVRAIPEVFDSKPGPTARKIGSYILWTAFAVDCVLCSTFLTGLAMNVTAVALAKQVLGKDPGIQWMDWLYVFGPMGLILFIVTPLLAYLVFPPEIKKSPEAPRWASEELSKMGPISKKEIATLITLIMAIILWATGSSYIANGTVAFLVVALLLLVGAISWDDILSNKGAWNLFLWIGGMVTLAAGLSATGFIDWLVKALVPWLRTMPKTTVVYLIVAIFFWIHYLFASLTAHTTALVPPFIPILVALGFNPKAATLLVAGTLGIMGVQTPYATAPAVVYYQSGYFTTKDFWKLGFIFALVYFIAYCIIGVPLVLSLFG